MGVDGSDDYEVFSSIGIGLSEGGSYGLSHVSPVKRWCYMILLLSLCLRKDIRYHGSLD